MIWEDRIRDSIVGYEIFFDDSLAFQRNKIWSVYFLQIILQKKDS
jgi:hypothetical protein